LVSWGEAVPFDTPLPPILFGIRFSHPHFFSPIIGFNFVSLCSFPPSIIFFLFNGRNLCKPSDSRGAGGFPFLSSLYFLLCSSVLTGIFFFVSPRFRFSSFHWFAYSLPTDPLRLSSGPYFSIPPPPISPGTLPNFTFLFLKYALKHRLPVFVSLTCLVLWSPKSTKEYFHLLWKLLPPPFPMSLFFFTRSRFWFLLFF